MFNCKPAQWKKIKEQWSDLNKPSRLYNLFEAPSCSLKYVTCFSAQVLHHINEVTMWKHLRDQILLMTTTSDNTLNRPVLSEDTNQYSNTKKRGNLYCFQSHCGVSPGLRLCFMFLICYCIVLFHSWFSMQASRHTSHTLRKKKIDDIIIQSTRIIWLVTHREVKHISPSICPPHCIHNCEAH